MIKVFKMVYSISKHTTLYEKIYIYILSNLKNLILYENMGVSILNRPRSIRNLYLHNNTFYNGYYIEL